VGGYLVAALWISLAIAGLHRADVRWPVRTGRRRLGRAREALGGTAALRWPYPRPVRVIGAITLASAAVLLALRAPSALAYAGAHPSLMAAATAIAALAAALAASLAVAVRGS
jgi:hypothetical protein